MKLDAEFSVVTLLGNHEQWMLKSLHDPTCHSWLVGMEAFDTIASYSAEAAGILRDALEQTGIGLITETVTLPYHVFFDAVPLTHLRFFQQLEMFHRAAHVICVHAGIDLDGRLMLQTPKLSLGGPTVSPTSIEGGTMLCMVIGTTPLKMGMGGPARRGREPYLWHRYHRQRCIDGNAFSRYQDCPK